MDKKELNTTNLALNANGQPKVALITGQDGSYLAEFLLKKGYQKKSITDRIDHLYQDPHEKDVKLFLHHGDMTDSMNLTRIIQPDEIYNLAAMWQYLLKHQNMSQMQMVLER